MACKFADRWCINAWDMELSANALSHPHLSLSLAVSLSLYIFCFVLLWIGGGCIIVCRTVHQREGALIHTSWVYSARSSRSSATFLFDRKLIPVYLHVKKKHTHTHKRMHFFCLFCIKEDFFSQHSALCYDGFWVILLLWVNFWYVFPLPMYVCVCVSVYVVQRSIFLATSTSPAMPSMMLAHSVVSQSSNRDPYLYPTQRMDLTCRNQWRRKKKLHPFGNGM